VPEDMTRSVCLLAVAAADGDEVPVPTADPAGLVAGDGRWGLKNLTVLTRTGTPPVPSVPSVGRAPPPRTPPVPSGGRALRLDLSGPAGRGPFALAAEAWVNELAAGLVLGRELAGLARAAGLVPDRVGDPWRPELVALVEEDLSLADRLDLGAAFPVQDRSSAARQVWLTGVRLAPDRSEPLILLLREPVPGSGSLLLLDVAGRVVGGHTLLAR
jgi:hypothetical protein